MKKYFSLLALPVLLLATSCAQEIQMTPAEIEALYAKSEDAVINTLEMSSTASMKMSGKGNGVTMNASVKMTEFVEIDLRDGVNLMKGTQTQKTVGGAAMGMEDVDGKIETYYNGVDTYYIKETEGTSVDKYCEPVSSLDFEDVMDEFMTSFSDITSVLPVDIEDAEEVAPKITKDGDIITFSYDLSKGLKESLEDLGLEGTISAKVSMSLNGDGLLVKETINIKVSMKNGATSATMEVSGNVAINYNKNLKITAPTDLNTYCK